MAFASGVFKQLRYKAETSYGVAPGATGATQLRRVTSTLDLAKDVYASKEIRTDQQRYDWRHGVRKVQGKINGELSAGTYKDFFAAALRRSFAAVTPISGASITIAGAGPTYTVTRAAGSFLTDGIKVGDVIQLSVGIFNAANISKNLLVTALTATVATVIPLNGVAMVAEGPIVGSTVSVPGKKTFIPPSGQTDTSFAIEHWFSDVAQSEVFTGCKINKTTVNLPATGLATVDFDMMGQNIATAQAAYYTSPTGVTNTGIEAAVDGLLIVNGSAVAFCTGLQFDIASMLTTSPVVGSNQYANVFLGTCEVSGQFTAHFQDRTLPDLFVNETESSLVVVLSANNTANADFIGFSFPRIKLGSATKDDGVKGLIATYQFEALYNGAGGAGTSSEQTTMLIQDTQA